MSNSLFPKDFEDIPAYEPKVHFYRANQTILCDTKNAREGTEEKDEVTCKRCLTLLERADEIEERGHVPLTMRATVTVESPPISKKNGKRVLLAWLNMLPDDISLEVKSGYSSPPTFVATWIEDRNAISE